MRAASLTNYNDNISMTGYAYNPARRITINPIKYQVDRLLKKGLNISHRRFLRIPDSITPFFNEVNLVIHPKESTYAFDINNGNSSGKYLLLLHGLGQNSHALMNLYSRIIKETNYSIFVPEYRGFGKNPPAKLSEKRFLEDAKSSLDYLITKKKIKPENISVIGHSFGGFVASNLVSAHPNLERLILVSSVDNFESEILNSAAIKHVNPIALFILKHIMILRNYLKNLFNTTEYLANTKIPVDLIHSVDDKVVSPQASEDLSKVCPKLNGLHLLPKGGHSMEPNKINCIISLLNRSK